MTAMALPAMSVVLAIGGVAEFKRNAMGGNENHYLIYDRDLTLAQANRLESQLIRKFRRVMDGGTLWNLSLGGQGRSGRIRYPGGHSNSAESWAMSLRELHYFNLDLNRLESHQLQQSKTQAELTS